MMTSIELFLNGMMLVGIYYRKNELIEKWFLLFLNEVGMNKRAKLAGIGKNEAQKCFHGNVMSIKSNLKPMTTLFSKYDVGELDGFWCAAFVYYCCLMAGFNMPAKYPHENKNIIFVGCLDWQMWAQLPENNFFYFKDDKNFIPSTGDIVLFDNVFCDQPHDHIGIVVENRVESMVVAEGNINNISGLVEREKDAHLRGFIRIPNDYDFYMKSKSL